ncbi:uncharacterized protein L969DRAFT_92409 [Mixia osmundae IAM 14324]|uniref:uncharacterized protein n=1 Tax=Mixia osmundae (strain CBS 9802 / IAM 14324 / JCM 22182 / KY 12970) TaxID=764103 RepID=UPI0004A55690|nr:uncharacterized protein L969DRAFT_92409 [Mixia osmundae IAM 14324]KEI41176.1 hypothetical protein L969DRAFT_92409 [Mixia osmundae IAM 14324]
MTTLISQETAQDIDQWLMDPSGGAFSIDQLMELAGLACATALQKTYQPCTHPKVLICAGPGNQGGDGLVAARHLWHFGYQPTLFYPKQTDKDLLFGFSFHGEPRPPFDAVINALNETTKPILSVDIPSAWDVEKGNVSGTFTPDSLISLTAPKLGSKSFKGTHWLGGRFVPPHIAQRFKLDLPDYPGSHQRVLKETARTYDQGWPTAYGMHSPWISTQKGFASRSTTSLEDMHRLDSESNSESDGKSDARRNL